MKSKIYSFLLVAFLSFAVAAPAQADLVYHGTTIGDLQLVPKPNKRLRDGKVIWSGDGVFATRDRRIALIYTSKRLGHFLQGVNLVDKVSPKEPVTLWVSGGKSEAEAMDNLYGQIGNSVGYIYMLDDSTFKREKGLGQMEVVSRVVPKYVKTAQYPKGIQTVNAREEIQKLVEQGLMKIVWEPLKESDIPKELPAH